MYDYLRKGELVMSKEKSLVVNNIQSLEELISSVKEAQRIFSAYSQEQVDKIFTAAALAANKARIPLAKMAVKETGMGIVEDKVIKITMPLNTFTTHTAIQRPAVLLRKIKPMALRRSQSLSVLLPLLFLQLIQLLLLYSRLLFH